MATRGFDIRTEAVCDIVLDLFKAINDSCECEKTHFAEHAFEKAAQFLRINCDRRMSVSNRELVRLVLRDEDDDYD